MENLTIQEFSFIGNFEPEVGPKTIAYYVIRLVQSVLAIGGNLLTIVAVSRTPDLRTATNLLVVNLGVADLLGGWTAPMAVVVSLQYGKPTWLSLCIIKEGLTLMVQGGNLFAVFFISVDRFMAAAYPLQYSTSMTVPKVRVIVISQWFLLCAEISTMLSLITPPRVDTVQDILCYYPELLPLWVLNAFILSQFAVLSCLTLLLYLRTGLIILRRDRKIRDSSCVTFPVHPGRQRKLTRTLSIVLGLYFACTLPSMIASNFVHAGESNHLTDFYHVTVVLWYMISFINPFLYAWQIPSFRKAFRHILHLRPDDK